MCLLLAVITPLFLKYSKALLFPPFSINNSCLRFQTSRLIDFIKEYITPYWRCLPAQSKHKCIPKWMEAHFGFFFSQSMQIYITKAVHCYRWHFSAIRKIYPLLAHLQANLQYGYLFAWLVCSHRSKLDVDYIKKLRVDNRMHENKLHFWIVF